MAFLSTTVNWDTLRTLTHPKVAQKIADNITGKIPLLYFLNKMGHKEYEDGGFNYMLPVFKELQNAQAYSGTQVLSASEADPVTTAIYERKQLTVPIMATGTKMLQNSGNNPEAIVSYMTTLVECAEESMKNSMDGQTIGIFSSQTESDPGISGLQNLVTATPTTGVAGGLDRSINTFWQNQFVSCATSFNTNGKNAMDTCFYQTVRGDETPTIIMMTQASYINLNRVLTGTLQYNLPLSSPKTGFGDVSFEHINFHGVPTMFGSNVPANSIYFLNLKYMKFLVHRERDMVIRDWITPESQDSLLARLYWAGNLVCSNMGRQGIVNGSGVDTF